MNSIHLKKVLLGFLLFFTSTGLVSNVQAQEDQSSLNINSDVIYNGNVESGQLDSANKGLDLFMEKSNAQNLKLQETESSQLTTVDQKLFQPSMVTASSEKDETKDISLFSDNFTFPEVVTEIKQEDSSYMEKTFLWSMIGLGASLILVAGWLLGRRFYNVFSEDKRGLY